MLHHLFLILLHSNENHKIFDFNRGGHAQNFLFIFVFFSGGGGIKTVSVLPLPPSTAQTHATILTSVVRENLSGCAYV